jgi:hypothetical protein
LRHSEHLSIANTLSFVEQRRMRLESDDHQCLARSSLLSDNLAASYGDSLAERLVWNVHSVFLAALL